MAGRHARPGDPDESGPEPAGPTGSPGTHARPGVEAEDDGATNPLRSFAAWLGLTRATDDQPVHALGVWLGFISTSAGSGDRPPAVSSAAPDATQPIPVVRPALAGWSARVRPRTVVALLGFTAIAIGVVAGGASLSGLGRWSTSASQAVASVPTITASPLASPPASAPPGATPYATVSAVPVTVPSPLPERTSLPIAYDGDPAYVSDSYPTAGGLYGVAIMIRVRFGAPVPDELKSLLEQAATVTVSRPIGDASWGWPDDQTMAFRPKEFWPAHTDVKVRFAWERYGLADADPVMRFRVGREQTLTIRAATQDGRLTRDGEFVRRVPVSLGMPNFPTTEGIKAIIEKYDVKQMVNNRPGATYNVTVPYAMRLTPSGEFLHSAPWNPNIGSYPTSHGCTNVSLEDGKWFYEHSLEGDPVIERGTGVPIDWWEGPGAMWNVGWRAWTGSAGEVPASVVVS